MDPVHDRGSMDPVHESGPWTPSKVGVHGPLVHVLSSPRCGMVPRAEHFQNFDFHLNHPVLSDCGRQSTHQCVFQVIYLTSTCLVLVYECNSRQATLNFAQTYVTSGVNVT